MNYEQPSFYFYRNPDELYHHGILGMKWGVRRYQPYGEGGYTPKSRKERKAEKKAAKIEKIREKTLKSNDKRFVNKNKGYLTDEELHSKAERFRDEEYLAQKAQKQYTEGQKAAIHIIEKVGKTAVTAAAVYVGYRFVKKSIVNSELFNTTMSAVNNLAEKGRKVAETGKKVSEGAVNAAYNVGKTVTETGKKVSEGAVNAAYNVGKTVDTTARNVASAAKATRAAAATSNAGKTYVRTVDNLLRKKRR